MKFGSKIAISVLMIFTFLISHGLGYYIYTHYIAEPVSRGVTLMLISLYGVIIFPPFCLIIPFLRGITKYIVMLLPPVFMIYDQGSSFPLRVTLIVICTCISYLLMFLLERLMNKPVVKRVQA